MAKQNPIEVPKTGKNFDVDYLCPTCGVVMKLYLAEFKYFKGKFYYHYICYHCGASVYFAREAQCETKIEIMFSEMP
jgi:predicted RNA-binding Zn-ribbon protein involved in translation (DUF1610 family)